MLLQNFIDGEYRDAKTDRSLDIVDPSTGEAYVQAPISSPADIDDACRAAARAFESWKRTTPSERSLAILRLADGLEANADEFIAEEVRNTANRCATCATKSSRCWSTIFATWPRWPATSPDWRAGHMHPVTTRPFGGSPWVCADRWRLGTTR